MSEKLSPIEKVRQTMHDNEVAALDRQAQANAQQEEKRLESLTYEALLARNVIDLTNIIWSIKNAERRRLEKQTKLGRLAFNYVFRREKFAAVLADHTQISDVHEAPHHQPDISNFAGKPEPHKGTLNGYYFSVPGERIYGADDTFEYGLGFRLLWGRLPNSLFPVLVGGQFVDLDIFEKLTALKADVTDNNHKYHIRINSAAEPTVRHIEALEEGVPLEPTQMTARDSVEHALGLVTIAQQYLETRLDAVQA